MFEVAVSEFDAVRVAALRHVGPFTELAPSFAKICEWAGAQGLFQRGVQLVGMFHDDPKTTAAAELRSDAAVTLPDDVDGPFDAGVEVRELPAGAYAAGVFQGPYERLPEVYGWLVGEWMPANGVRPTDGPSFEVYLNDPTAVAPEEIRTEIRFPVERV
ncbi:MAG: GyrI-like domain-containing protein [Planctomycetota bacterium]